MTRPPVCRTCGDDGLVPGGEIDSGPVASWVECPDCSTRTAPAQAYARGYADGLRAQAKRLLEMMERCETRGEVKRRLEDVLKRGDAELAP